MSLSYAEMYQNKIKKRNKIFNEEEKKNSTTQKIISLIKRFPVNQRKTFKNDKNFKPRRIQNKSVEIIQKYRKTSNNKKKEALKQKIENKKDNKNLNNSGRNIEKNKRKQIKKNDIHDTSEIKTNKCYRTDIVNENLNNKTDDLRNKYINKLSKTYDVNDNKQKKIYQEESDNFNKANKFDSINKTKNTSTSIDTYFDIFRLRKNAASFKDKLKNIYLNKYNSNNIFYNKRNINYHKGKTYSDFTKKRSKTYYKAIKFKEELENKIRNDNINNRLYKSYNDLNDKNLLNLKENKKEKEKSIEKEMSKHILDEKDKRPKILKKFLTNKNSLRKGNQEPNNNVKNLRDRNFEIFYKNINNSKDDEIAKNNLMNDFSSEIYQIKFKRKVKFNNKSLNLIVQENPKLNSLLRKIPSNRENRDKSFDLKNYIKKLRDKSDNIKYIRNIKYKSAINLGIYPVNEWEPISRLKFHIK